MNNSQLISMPALVARVRRHLLKKDQKLIKFAEKWCATYGEYGLAELGSNRITAYHIDVETLAKELGALFPYEEVDC